MAKSTKITEKTFAEKINSLEDRLLEIQTEVYDLRAEAGLDAGPDVAVRLMLVYEALQEASGLLLDVGDEVLTLDGKAKPAPKVAPAADKIVWRPLARKDPRSEAAVEAIRAVWRKHAEKTGKPYPATPLVNDRRVSRDGTKVRGRVSPLGPGYPQAPTGVYTAELVLKPGAYPMTKRGKK